MLLPAPGPQLVMAFIITNLLVVLAKLDSDGVLPASSQILHESEAGGSGWAGFMISNIPMRLREVGLLAQGHAANIRQSWETPASDLKPISTSLDPLSKPHFLICLRDLITFLNSGPSVSVPHWPGRSRQ